MADLINILNRFVQEQPEAVAVRHQTIQYTFYILILQFIISMFQI